MNLAVAYNPSLQGHLDDVLGMFLNLFPASVDDGVGSLRNIIATNVYVAGGAIVNYLINQPIADYDVFIKTDAARDAIVEYVRENKEALQLKVEVRAITENAITLKFVTGEVIQLVTRFTGDPSRVFKSFDFEHCKCYYDPHSKDLVYNPALILNKMLVYTGEDDYPLNTMKRLVKFIRRGWNIENQSILNLAKKMSKTDLSNPEVYKEQTIGFYGSSMT